MKWEDSFHALVIHDSTHCEGLINPPASSRDYCAAKYLYTLFVAFFDAATDIYRIAYFEMRYLFLQPLTFNSVQHFGCCQLRSLFLLFCHFISCSNSYPVKRISFEIRGEVYMFLWQEQVLFQKLRYYVPLAIWASLSHRFRKDFKVCRYFLSWARFTISCGSFFKS